MKRFIRFMFQGGGYQAIHQADGTWTIPQVQVFERGTHQGYTFDDAWINQALANLQQWAGADGTGYRPVIVFGQHTQDPVTGATIPLPARGFLDNFQYNQTTGILYADFSGLSEANLTDLSNGMWPYPSLEIQPGRHVISGVTCLGGTEPYFKYPPVIPDVLQAEFQFSAEELAEFQTIPAVPPPSTIAEGLARQEVEEKTWDAMDRIREAGWMYRDLVKEVKGNVALTAEQQATAIRALNTEFQSIVTAATEEIIALPVPPAPAPAPGVVVTAQAPGAPVSTQHGGKKPMELAELLAKLATASPEEKAQFKATLEAMGITFGTDDDTVRTLTEANQALTQQVEEQKQQYDAISQQVETLTADNRRSKSATAFQAATDRVDTLLNGTDTMMFDADGGKRYNLAPAVHAKAVEVLKRLRDAKEIDGVLIFQYTEGEGDDAVITDISMYSEVADLIHFAAETARKGAFLVEQEASRVMIRPPPPPRPIRTTRTPPPWRSAPRIRPFLTKWSVWLPLTA